MNNPELNDEISAEMTRAAGKLPEGWNDAHNTGNDWIAYAITHLGKATSHGRNDGVNKRAEVVKAIGLLYNGVCSGRFE